MNILIISLWTQGDGMSGGDNIWISFAKYWSKKHKVSIFGSKEAKKISTRSGLKTNYLWTVKPLGKNNMAPQSLLKNFIYRTFVSLNIVWKNRKKLKNFDVVFSASDFWPDVIPSVFVKILNPKIKWVSAFYFFAPKPWQDNNPYSTSPLRRVVGFFYWFTQIFSYHLIKRSNLVVACNEIDRKIFIKDGTDPKKIIAIYGGVDLDAIKKIPTPQKKKYDAVFMARFHPQKGPMEAVRVWKNIVKKNPKAKLAMIGNGTEEKPVLEYIKNNHLEDNVTFLGFMDGKEKYKILKSSKIFIHPAIYETGGMAAAEGMACELPVVSFKHDGFKYCYPKGMLTISPIGDVKKMSEAVLNLFEDKSLYSKLRRDALDLVEKEWDWKQRALLVIKHISNV